MISAGDIERSMAARGMRAPQDRAHALASLCMERGLDPVRCGVFPPRDSVLRSRALTMARQATKPAQNMPTDLLWLMNLGVPSARTIEDTTHVTGGSIADSGTNGIYTATGTPYTTAKHDEQQIHIVGAPSAANNGTFLITAATTSALTYGNAPAVSEATPGADVYTFGNFLNAADLSGNPSGLLGAVGGNFEDATDSTQMRVDAQSFWLAGGNYIGYRGVAGTSRLISQPDFAALSALNGSGLATLGGYFRIENNAGGDMLAVSAASGSVTAEAVRIRPNGASGMRLIRTQASTTQNYDVAHTIDTAGFHLYAFVYQGASVNELWVDGVMIGNSSPGVSQEPVGLDRILIGGSPASGTGLLRTVGTFGIGRRLSADEQIALKNYFAASVLTPGEALP